MKKSKIFLVAILLIVIVIVGVLIASGSISLGGNYKVTIQGTAYYDMFNGWGVTYNSYLVQEDSLISVLWYWPWETKDIQIKVELQDSNGKIYHGDTWAGTLSSIVGSREFAVELRHIPAGSYTGTIYLYEVEKSWFGLSESSRNLRGHTGIPQIIIG